MPFSYGQKDGNNWVSIKTIENTLYIVWRVQTRTRTHTLENFMLTLANDDTHKIQNTHAKMKCVHELWLLTAKAIFCFNRDKYGIGFFSSLPARIGPWSEFWFHRTEIVCVFIVSTCNNFTHTYVCVFCILVLYVCKSLARHCHKTQPIVVKSNWHYWLVQY